MANTSILKGYSRRERKNFLFCYLMVLIPVAQLAVFWVYVNFNSIILSFQDSLTGEFTFQNFKDVWTAVVDKDRYGFNLGKIIGRSALLWFIANVPVFIFSMMTTYVLYRRVLGHYVFRVIYMIPSIIGAVIWTTIIKFIVSNDGPIVEMCEKLNIGLPYLAQRNGLFGAEETAFPTLIGLTVFLGVGGGNAVITGAYARMPQELSEVGRLDGISFWKEFWKIALPCAWPTIATVITFNLCGMLTADGNVFLYTNGTGEPGMATTGYYLYYMVYRINQSGNMNDFGYKKFNVVITDAPENCYALNLSARAYVTVDGQTTYSDLTETRSIAQTASYALHAPDYADNANLKKFVAAVVDETSLEIVGSNETLSATWSGVDTLVEGSDVTTLQPVWSSSDETVATVNQEGVVTPVKAGKVDISVALGSVTATKNMEVVGGAPVESKNATVDGKTISLASISLRGNLNYAAFEMEAGLTEFSVEFVGYDMPTIRFLANEINGDTTLTTNTGAVVRGDANARLELKPRYGEGSGWKDDNCGIADLTATGVYRMTCSITYTSGDISNVAVTLYEKNADTSAWDRKGSVSLAWTSDTLGCDLEQPLYIIFMNNVVGEHDATEFTFVDMVELSVKEVAAV